ISKRRHRPQTVAVVGTPRGMLWQAVDAAGLRGARLRLRGKLRVANHGRGRLWMRVERGDRTGFSDDMPDRPVVSSDWELAEVVGTVDSDATRIVFGTITTGDGTVWYDEIELAAQGSDGRWSSIDVKNPGFETADPFEGW